MWVSLNAQLGKISTVWNNFCTFLVFLLSPWAILFLPISPTSINLVFFFWLESWILLYSLYDILITPFKSFSLYFILYKIIIRFIKLTMMNNQHPQTALHQSLQIIPLVVVLNSQIYLHVPLNDHLNKFTYIFVSIFVF